MLCEKKFVSNVFFIFTHNPYYKVENIPNIRCFIIKPTQKPWLSSGSAQFTIQYAYKNGETVSALINFT